MTRHGVTHQLAVSGRGEINRLALPHNRGGTSANDHAENLLMMGKLGVEFTAVVIRSTMFITQTKHMTSFTLGRNELFRLHYMTACGPVWPVLMCGCGRRCVSRYALVSHPRSVPCAWCVMFLALTPLPPPSPSLYRVAQAAGTASAAVT